MAKYFDKKTLEFLLYQCHSVEQLVGYPYFADHSPDTFALVLDAAEQIAQKLLYPIHTEMDRQEPRLEQGQVRVHPRLKEIIKKFGDDGWINAAFSYDEGGQQLPQTILNSAAFIFQAANYSASVFPFLTSGAANLIRTFGSEALKAAFLPAMYSGSWQGTMALTEPDAGSSLSDISTMAVPGQSNGSYFIQGQKIFISAGDHDAAENIIHLMLAKIKGGPAGAKGISLFVVPKYRVNEAGQLILNDVQTSGLYHKMGYKGAPIVHLTLGENNDCMGYLVGEPHKGLSYMFQMMNEARLGVGMNATAIASAAFEASKAYALERKQGRKIDEKDPAKPQTAIINHADVRRMLLFQKAVVEGSLSLLLYCSKLADISHASTNTTEKEETALLLDLLTPIAKSYPSEMGVLSCSAAIQVLGGAGYTTDFPLEQYYREARIHPIHEGTTGIHGLDLLGRKLGQHQGRGLAILLSKIQADLADIKSDNLLPAKQQFLQYLDIAAKATEHLLKIAAEDPERFLADASLFLEMYGHIVMAWQWLQMAQVAEKTHDSADFSQDFLQGKTSCCEYYIAYELPKVAYLAGRLQSSSYPTLHCKPEWI